MTFKRGGAGQRSGRASVSAKWGRRLAGPGPGQAERASACGLGRKRRPAKTAILAPWAPNPRRPLIIFMLEAAL